MHSVAISRSHAVRVSTVLYPPTYVPKRTIQYPTIANACQSSIRTPLAKKAKQHQLPPSRPGTIPYHVRTSPFPSASKRSNILSEGTGPNPMSDKMDASCARLRTPPSAEARNALFRISNSTSETMKSQHWSHVVTSWRSEEGQTWSRRRTNQHKLFSKAIGRLEDDRSWLNVGR